MMKGVVLETHATGVQRRRTRKVKKTSGRSALVFSSSSSVSLP